MARNLVKEMKDRAEEAQKAVDAETAEVPTPTEDKKKPVAEKEIQLITMEQALLNNLNIVIQQNNEILALMKKGFESVGVKF